MKNQNVIDLIIKNFDELSGTELKRNALKIIDAGISAVLPYNIMPSKLHYIPSSKTLTVNGDHYDFSRGRLFVLGGGKASGAMAEALESIIPPEDIAAGLVNCSNSDYKTRKIGIIIAGHPFPDERGLAGVKQMLNLKNKHSINENDLIICLLSGGGSALMPYPIDEVGLDDKKCVTELLIHSGAEIREINIVRKCLSKIKGGKLGTFFSPTKVISLIISDVLGNDLSAIASGPTVTNFSTFKDAYMILKKYDLLEKTPPSVINYIKKNCEKEQNRSFKETNERLDNCNNYIIGDLNFALDGMIKKAKDLRYKPKVVTSAQKGDPTNAAWDRAREIMKEAYSGYDVLLVGGETTPKLPENTGTGGRNQHFIAESVLAMKDLPGQWVVASAATDGSDFVPGVAGAIIDNGILRVIKSKGLKVESYLKKYDSNTLLTHAGNSLIKTGDTGTNVGDIIVYILNTETRKFTP